MISSYLTLRRLGVLGMNQRNSDYIAQYNNKRYYALVDDKLQTKKIAQTIGLPTPKLLHVFHEVGEVKQLKSVLDPLDDFVIKPACGAGGRGILVIKEQIKERYRKIDNRILTLTDLEYHLANILNGIYSLTDQDKVLIEYRAKVDDSFQQITYQGVPDIRIITLLGFPVMAMARLPTYESGGRANLHQHAIGVGIHLSTGTTFGGVIGNSIITEHPDTLHPLAGLQIPYWDNILHIAAECYEVTQLGYIGVDIVIDRELGPLVLEMNARPGLNIQIANQAGLLPRLTYIEKEFMGHTFSPEARVNLCKKFSSQFESTGSE